MSTIKDKISTWGESLAMLEGTDRLEYLLDLAKESTTLDPQKRLDENKVHGCMSQIWVDVELQDKLVTVNYDSDAMITKGIARVICDCFTNSDVKEATTIGIDDFDPLGIQPLLTAQRRNGLGNLIHTVVNKCKNL
jgi:cysteine desulfuration protein SufE